MMSARSLLSRPTVAVVITAALLAVVEVVDYLTGPFLSLAIAYFIPIVYAAWALGRWWAFVTVLFAEAPTYIEQMTLVRMDQISTTVAASNIIARFLIFAFVAEVTWRLVDSREQLRRTAQDLRATSERLQEAYRSIEADIRAAGLLQAGVMAFHIPAVPGIHIGTSVKYAGPTGGDFADVGVIGDRVYACVADVSGKGVPAALFTTLLRHLLLESHDLDHRGPDVVAYLDRALSRVLPPEYFVTLFYAEIEPSTGRVDYVNAGHPPGLIYRPAKARLETAEPTARLLGLYEDDGIESVQFTLSHGDSLTLYTDGATDSKTTEGMRLGDTVIRRLAQEFSHMDAQPMADAIRRGIEAATDPDLRDDLAIICVKVTSPPHVR